MAGRQDEAHATSSEAAAVAAATERVRVIPPPPALADELVCCILREISADAPRSAPSGAAPPSSPPSQPARELPVQAATAHAAPAVAGVVPSNVYACLNLLVQGEVHALAAPGITLPPAFVTGPFRAPLHTRASVPLRSVSLVLQPWLLADWFGLAPGGMADAIRALEAAEGDDDDDLQPGAAATRAWVRALCQSLASAAAPQAPDADATRSRQTADRLAAALGDLASHPARPASPARPGLDRILLAEGSVRQAAGHAGLGERQFERRFLATHGLPPKRWLRIKRFEQGLAGLVGAGGTALASLSALAQDTGYADQGHMTREFRQIAGHTPARLQAALVGQAAGYWAFRPARVGFVQDPEGGAR